MLVVLCQWACRDVLRRGPSCCVLPARALPPCPPPLNSFPPLPPAGPLPLPVQPRLHLGVAGLGVGLVGCTFDYTGILLGMSPVHPGAVEGGMVGGRLAGRVVRNGRD